MTQYLGICDTFQFSRLTPFTTPSLHTQFSLSVNESISRPLSLNDYQLKISLNKASLFFASPQTNVTAYFVVFVIIHKR